MPMRIVFMGSGLLACPALRELLQGKADTVVAVVTQPDRPSGRRLHLTPCPAKAFLKGRDVPLLSPEDVNEPAVVTKLASMKPDLAIVADFGQFLRRPILELFPKGAINIHPSLLPRYRGAAPMQWAVANGDTETGVSVLYVTEKMDAGDLIAQEKVPIRDEDTAATLEPLLAEVGATLLVRALEAIRTDRVKRTPQEDAKATQAPKLSKEDGRIDWPLPAASIRNRIRGFVPWPGCYCEVPDGSGHFLRVFKARVEEGSGTPGRILKLSGDGPLVACGDKAVRLLEVQPEGKKPMSGSAYLCGHKLTVGEMLG